MARFLFNYRRTPQSTTGTFPAQLLLGRPIRSRLDLLRPDLAGKVRGKQKEAHDTHSSDRDLSTGDLVYACNFGRGAPWLPGRIVNQTGPIPFQVQMEEEQLVWRRIKTTSGNALTNPPPEELTMENIPQPSVDQTCREEGATTQEGSPNSDTDVELAMVPYPGHTHSENASAPRRSTRIRKHPRTNGSLNSNGCRIPL